VTVYTKPGCRACDRVKAKLDEFNVPYQAVDITRNEEAYTYVTQVLKSKSVPVIVSDVYEPILGYDPLKLRELIDYVKLEGLHDYVYEGDE